MCFTALLYTPVHTHAYKSCVTLVVPLPHPTEMSSCGAKLIKDERGTQTLQCNLALKVRVTATMQENYVQGIWTEGEEINLSLCR